MAVVAGLIMRAMSVYTATEAAKLCGVSLRTVQRKSAQLEAAGAWKDTSGQWHIPMAAMRTSGLTPGRPTGPDPTPRDTSVRQHDSSDSVTAIIARYRATEQNMAGQLAEWRRRAEVAEVQAAERQKIIEIQDRALRMLEEAAAASVIHRESPEPPPAPEPSPPTDSAAGRRPSWFRRRKRPQPVCDYGMVEKL